MLIKSLQLHNFRNFTEQYMEFDPEINVLIGENAQGKTNVLEAIYLLAVGKSHRTSRDQDLIQWTQDSASVTAQIEKQNRLLRMSLIYGMKGKKAMLDGLTQTRMTDFVGHFQVVLFAPEDLQLVKNGPAQRRRFIDMELGQIQVKYLFHLSQYHRILQQRNSFLKQEKYDEQLLEVLTLQLAEHAAQIIRRRSRFIQDLGEFAKNIYHSISSGGETLTLRYYCSIPHLQWNQETNINDIKETVYQTMLDRLKSDKIQGYTTIGPHRDDLVLELNGQAVQAFASQGQQRTIALALRLAEIDFIYREMNDYPVLLLDDVLSELDDVRQRNLVLSMREKVQTIITTTSLFELQDKLRYHTHLLKVRSGIIQTEA